jgi:hypothetical protein
MFSIFISKKLKVSPFQTLHNKVLNRGYLAAVGISILTWKCMPSVNLLLVEMVARSIFMCTS